MMPMTTPTMPPLLMLRLSSLASTRSFVGLSDGVTLGAKDGLSVGASVGYSLMATVSTLSLVQLANPGAS